MTAIIVISICCANNGAEEEHRTLAQRIEFVTLEQAEPSPIRISEFVYDNLPAYKKNRCAIFTDHEDVGSLASDSSLHAEVLEPDENFHWTGVNMTLRKKRYSHVIVGDYADWFCWYMKFQRFNAFQLLILVKPISRMMEDERRGFLDGLLTRLINKQSVHKVIIIEEEQFRPLVDVWLANSVLEQPELARTFGANEFQQVVLSMLSGRTLSRSHLILETRMTLTSKINHHPSALFEKLDNNWFFDMKPRRARSLSEEGQISVQGMSVFKSFQEPVPEKLFEANKRRRHARSDEWWLQAIVETHILNNGWFTIPDLYNFVNDMIHRVMTDNPNPSFADSDFTTDNKLPAKVILPSQPILRRIVNQMVRDGKLNKTIWFRELGRPSIVYYGKNPLPFREERCGQCAFFVSLRKQCRIWWLLGRAYGIKDPRWDSRGDHALSAFELYKMKNAHRISPHSSACMKFVDKKRNYSLKNVPEACDICGQSLPEMQGEQLVCSNCRTLYFKTKRAVRVLTGYEDQFQKKYSELAGRKPASDLTRLHEEQFSNTFRTLEQIDFEKHRFPEEGSDPQPITLMLFPDDRMMTRDGQLFLLGRRRVESVPLAGSTIVDHGVLDEEQAEELRALGAIVRSVAKRVDAREKVRVRHYLSPLARKAVSENPEFVRGFALAMAKSAIQATERIGLLSRVYGDEPALMVQAQQRFLRRMERAPTNKFLIYEALVMKHYWARYSIALKISGQRFGPRTKSRFVREHVSYPTGRAKGYSAIDSAINYLHQRRLFKIIQTNSQLGISSSGEGILHFKRWNARQLGLILDFADPLKFADREKLLETVIAFGVNWRDFHTATDRQGLTFYYPKSEIIDTLEKVSDQADNMITVYVGREQKLSDAYSTMVSGLTRFLNGQSSSFEPFVFRSE